MHQHFVAKLKEMMYIPSITLALRDRNDAWRNCMNEEPFAQQKVYAHHREIGVERTGAVCESRRQTCLNNARYCVPAAAIITPER
jgi:hypothetical protein